MLKEVDDIVTRTGMRSRTELVERAVESYIKELRDSKIVVLKPWTEDRAKSAVMKFLKSRDSATVSDIVEALGMEPEMAFRVVRALAGEEKIE